MAEFAEEVIDRIRIARRKFCHEYMVVPKIIGVTTNLYEFLRKREIPLVPLQSAFRLSYQFFEGSKIMILPEVFKDVEFQFYLDEQDFNAKCSAKD